MRNFSLFLRLLPLLLIVLLLLRNEVFLGSGHPRLHTISPLLVSYRSIFFLDNIRNLFVSQTFTLILYPLRLFLSQKIILSKRGYIVDMFIFEFE